MKIQVVEQIQHTLKPTLKLQKQELLFNETNFDLNKDVLYFESVFLC